MIDVNAIIPAHPEGLGELVTEARAAGRTRLLARHALALGGDPVHANRRALEAARDEPGMFSAIGVVAPLRSDDPDRGVRAIAASGVVGLWLASDAWYGGIGTPSAAADHLLRQIGRAGLPLLVPLERWGDATRIGEATAGLGIPVVLVGAHYTHIVDDVAACERYPHLMLETSRLAHFDAVARVIRIIGHERLLLGSGLPFRPPSAARDVVLAAGLGETATRAVLGGNAAALFGVDLAAEALPARPDGRGAIDVHGHLAPTPWDVPDLDAHQLADAMAAHGIERTVVSSVDALVGDLESGNAATVRACADDPRLLGYLVADPRDPGRTRDHLRRWGDSTGIVGVKVHCEYADQPLASAAMAELFGLLAEHGRPVKVHVAGAGWDSTLLQLARRHPDLPVLAAHAGPGAPSADMARVTAQVDNLWLELASSATSLPEAREVVRLAGPDRILFGTDAPLLDPAWALGSYADVGLRPDTHPGVFRTGARRMLGLDATKGTP